MTMVATTLDVGRPSIDVAAGDLVLRICNSWRQGQLVRLKAAKCTIGSAPRCTLRLRARGVRPVHCLILRGQATTVIRRWAADTRLNDQAFADAVLSPGDRVSIGAIELEVLSLGGANLSPPATADHPAASVPQMDFLVTLDRQALEEEQHRLEQLAAQLQQSEASLAAEAEHYRTQRNDTETQRQAVDQERQQWQAEREEAQRQVEAQRNELAARLAELQARENGLSEERRQWEAERSQCTSQVTAEGEQLRAQRAELDAERRGFGEQRQQWQAEREETQRQVEAQRNELAARLAELQARENGLSEERRQWEAERSQSETQLTAERESFIARQAQLEAERRSVEQQRQQWQAEQDEAQRQVEEQHNALAARLAELQARQNRMSEERRQWEAERSQCTSQVTTEGEQLRAQQAQLDAERRGFDEQRQQWQAEREEAERQAEERRNELAARLAELRAREDGTAEERRQWEAEKNQSASRATTAEERLRAEQAKLDNERRYFDEQQQQWQAEREEAERRVEQQRNELAARQADLEAERNAFETDRRQREEQDQLARVAEPSAVPDAPAAEADRSDEAAPQAPDFQIPAEGAPVDLAEVLRRVGARVETEEETSPAPSTDVAQIEPLRGDRELSPMATAGHGDEESIDAYMSRLMQRVRSKSDEPTQASYAASRSEPQSARRTQTDAAAAPASTEPVRPKLAVAPRKPVKLLPRSAAPEKHIDLTALRELANLSARTAISRHSHRILIDAMRSKLAMAMLALAAGGGLFWMWQRYGAVEMTFYYSLAAGFVAIYFGVQYALLTGKLRINERGHLNIDWSAFAATKPAEPNDGFAAPDSPLPPATDATPVDDGGMPLATKGAPDSACD